MRNDHYLRRRIQGGFRRRAVAAAAAAIVLAAGCASQPTILPSVAPSATAGSSSPASAGPGPDAWAFADLVPPDVVTQAPSLEPGFHCSPCHPAAASQLF